MFDQEPDGDPHGECALEIKRLKDLIMQAKEIGKGFSQASRLPAIIHHAPECTFFQLALAGRRPKNDDACDCQAKPIAKKLLAFMQATKDLEP